MQQIPGVIVRLIVDKGFGFVRRTDGDVNYFFHRSVVQGAPFELLHEGQAVRFKESSATTKGPRADRVVVQ